MAEQVLIRSNGTGFTVSDPFPRTRHGKPAIGTRRVSWQPTPEMAARAALDRLTGQTPEIPAEPVEDGTAQPRGDDMTQLSILEPTPTPAEVRTRTARWLDRLRDAIWSEYRGRVVTADVAHAVMAARPDLAIPDGVSPNALGKLFSDWPRAERAGGFVRSERPEAHGNLIATWRLR